jgi:hypothetical protein
MSIEQIHRQEMPRTRSESDWTVIEVNGQPRVHGGDGNELDLFAPQLQRLEAVLRELSRIRQMRQNGGEISDTLSIKSDMLACEKWQLEETCVSMGLLPETVQ